MTDRFTLHHGDCLDVLPTLPAGSVDAVVCDPPYGLSFMGKGWDHAVPGETYWREALRVAKPGAHLLAFGGTRTFHRLWCAAEDAGWEVRNTISWLYGQGFPKSLNLDGDWTGWGTDLKPAWEPILVARKPLVGTVAANVLRHGTGALNIDGCKVNPGERVSGGGSGRVGNFGGKSQSGASTTDRRQEPHANGRWPANVALDAEAAAMLDEQSGPLASGKMAPTHTNANRAVFGQNASGGYTTMETYGDRGGASRFFYCAKASVADRNEGCDGLEEREAQSTGWSGDGMPLRQNGTQRKTPRARNHHPTVKPTDLMRWLCRLVTPTNGIVLDPFMGSGSTGKAAVLEGFRFIGIEREAEYVEIARARIGAAAAQGALFEGA